VRYFCRRVGGGGVLVSDLRQGGIADRVCSSAKGRTRMFIHGVYVNMIPRMAVMVSGKVSSGLL